MSGLLPPRPGSEEFIQITLKKTKIMPQTKKTKKKTNKKPDSKQTQQNTTQHYKTKQPPPS